MLMEHKEEDIKRIFEEKINHNTSFSNIYKTEVMNFKKLASFFQDAIHFHSGHLQPKTLMFTLKSTSRIVLNKTWSLFLVFH